MLDFKGYPLAEYIQINDKEIVFPEEIYVAYAVCSEKCGNTEFIVDSSSQVCQYCGKLMFRTVVKKYVLDKK